MMRTAYQPKTGAACGCRRGVERDNCPNCEGTGQVIDFAAIRARRIEPASNPQGATAGEERLEILGDAVDGRLGTQYASDEIVINCGARTADVTRRVLQAVNSFEAMRDALHKIQEHVTEANLSDGTVFVDEVEVVNWCDAALALADSQE